MFWKCLSLHAVSTKSVASFTPRSAASFTTLMAFTFSALTRYASLVLHHLAIGRWRKWLLIWSLTIMNHEPVSTRVPRQFVYGHFVYDTSSTDISSTDISSTTVYQRVGQLYIQLLF